MFLVFAACDNAGSSSSTAEEIEEEKVEPKVTTWPSGLKASLGQTLADVPLAAYTDKIPGTFSWEKPADPVGSLGTQSHSVVFTPDDAVHYKTAKKSVNVEVTVGIEMVWLRGGAFNMGAPASENNYTYEKPVHAVILDSFHMGKYEVTQEQYEAVMGTNPSKTTYEADPGENPARRPVDTVSWFSAIVFCNKLSVLEGLTPVYKLNGGANADEWGEVPPTTGNDAVPGEGNHNKAWWNEKITRDATADGYQLPTEAQWEYACRAGTQTPYNNGDGLPPPASVDGSSELSIINPTIGWYRNNSGNPRKTHEVGLLPPNAWGLYDMHGNVAEHCWDWYLGTSYPNTSDTNPTGPAQTVGAATAVQRVRRGGSYDDGYNSLRSAYRAVNANGQAANGPERTSDTVGFRVARAK